VVKSTFQSRYELESDGCCCVRNDMYLIVYQSSFNQTGNTSRIEKTMV
jgi:hypothetical protein